MNDDKVRLEPDGALKWTLLSLFVPFAILVWFYRTNRQINYLNKIRGNDCRVMTPWWLSILAVVFSLAFVIIILDRSGAAVPSFLYLFASLVFLPGGLALMALALVYLVQHIIGVTSLGVTNQDKSSLITTGVLSCVLLPPLVVLVVYRSQLIINRALSDRTVADPA